MISSLPDPVEMRAQFEEQLFNQMFWCMTFQSVDCPTKADAMARNPDGLYVDDTVNAAWWAWQAALKWAHAQ